MAGKRRWGLIILGVVIFVVVVGVGVIATVSYMVYRQMDVQTITTDSPDVELQKALAPFAGQEPYIELLEGDEERSIVHREQEKATPTSLSKLHAVIWDPRERKVVRLSLPFWLMRLGGSHRSMTIDSHQAGGVTVGSNVRLNVSAADIERHGPGLILDHTGRRGERIVVWAE
jgi:hypothetical protein